MVGIADRQRTTSRQVDRWKEEVIVDMYDTCCYGGWVVAGWLWLCTI